MSILNVNKINPVGGGSTITIAGIASVTSSVTSPSFVGDVTGNVTGNVTGDATGLSGNPSINTTGIITATKFSGNAAQGGGNDAVFQMNGMTVTQDFEFPDGQSAMSVGPITINSGVEVTVPDGQNWVIL